MKAQFIVADFDPIALVELHGFDSFTVDQSSRRNCQILECIAVSVARNDGVARLHASISEQSDRIFLGPPQHHIAALQPELAAPKPAGLDRKPCGFSQLM